MVFYLAAEDCGVEREEQDGKQIFLQQQIKVHNLAHASERFNKKYLKIFIDIISIFKT